MKLVDQFLSDFLYLGIWGSVDVTNPNDFVKVIQPNPTDFNTPGTFNKDDNSCRLTTGVEVEVIVGKLGTPEDPQSYVIGAEVRPVKQTWYYANKGKQTFQHTASVAYREILSQKMSAKAGSSMLDKMASDLFYPMTLKTSAIALKLGSIIALFGMMMA